MLPREHGAWSLLLTPFAAALLIDGRLNWSVAAALAAVLAAFLMRAPLVVLARQHWVWRNVRAESSQARRWLLVLLPVITVAAAVLLHDWGWLTTVSMGAGAFALTLAAVWATIQNRQRSVWFQVFSCAGLTFSSVAAARSAAGHFPAWAWPLWALCTLNGAAGILVVHTRLDALIARKAGSTGNRFHVPAWCAVFVSAAAAAACVIGGKNALALAPALASAAFALELRTMDLDTRLTTVGLRAMTLSIIHALLLVVAFRTMY